MEVEVQVVVGPAGSLGPDFFPLSTVGMQKRITCEIRTGRICPTRCMRDINHFLDCYVMYPNTFHAYASCSSIFSMISPRSVLHNAIRTITDLSGKCVQFRNVLRIASTSG